MSACDVAHAMCTCLRSTADGRKAVQLSCLLGPGLPAVASVCQLHHLPLGPGFQWNPQRRRGLGGPTSQRKQVQSRGLGVQARVVQSSPTLLSRDLRLRDRTPQNPQFLI